MAAISAFVDEFGNNSFKFTEQGSHFIVAAIISKDENLSDLKEAIGRIRKAHNFQSGEIKSSGVGKNHARRKRVLEDLTKLPISVYAVLVDKRELKGTGFEHKRSFYKFLNNLLYKELFRTFPSLDLYVDEHGSNDFMREFKAYVEKHHQRTLFSGSDFNIINSENHQCIQIADFVAGTLGYIFDESKKSESSDDFLGILKPIISSLSFFPKRWSFDEFKNSNLDQSFDPKIAEVSFLRIQDFIDRTKGDDQQKKDQINFLKLLLLLQRAYARNRYVSTKEIFSHLNQSRSNPLKEEYFRTKVVGGLRDTGVLIASSRAGYKIPTSCKDLDNFVKHGRRIIIPMLNRIKSAREAIKLATGNELDLLSKPDFKELQDILDK